MLRTLGCSLLVMFTAADVAIARPQASDFYPDALPDPFVGDYTGAWLEGEEVDIVLAAQVINLGRDEYLVRLQAKLDMRATPKAIATGKAKGGKLEFEGDNHFGTIEDGVITGGRTPGEAHFRLEKVVRESPTLGAVPPPGAVVLFDGSSLDAWQDPIGWEIVDGDILMVTPSGEDLISNQNYTDCKLHVEFRTSWMPKSSGQGRSNSGVFVQNDYEVQILDSYGLESYYDDCGAIYKVAAPMVNASRPPLQWQTYDIEFRAARFDANGNVIENPRMTVYQNGTLIHNNQELWWITGWKDEDRAKPHPQDPGPIKLQCHSNYVQFRNIWLVDLTK